MPKLKPGTIVPTPEEDAAITAAAISADSISPSRSSANRMRRMDGVSFKP